MLLAATLGSGITVRAEQTADKPLTVQDCVRLALGQHPTLRAVRKEMDAARAAVGSARSGALPQVGVNAGYTDQEPASPNLRNYSATLTLSQSLFNSGRVSAQVAQAQENFRAAESVVTLTAQDITLAVRQAYYTLLAAQRLQGVAEERLRQAEAHRQQAQANYEAGVVARADVLKAEVEVAEARLGAIKAENGVQLAKAELTNAMGVDAEVTLEVMDDFAFVKADKDLQTALAAAFRQRPELQQNTASTRAARLGVRAAATGTKPEVSLKGDWGLKDTGFLPGEVGWTVGVAVNLPLFDGNATRSQVAKTKAEVEKLQAQESRLRQNIALEVRQACLELREAEERIIVAATQVASARESLRVTEGRYREGVASMVELLDAQTAMTAAQTNEVQALYDHKIAQAKLAKATGEGVAQ